MKKEVLRYLGYKDQYICDELNKMIDDLIDEIYELANVRYIYKKFKIKKDNNRIKIIDTNFVLEGNSIVEYLNKSRECFLLAVTLGIDVDKRIDYYSKVDIVKSLILDSVATAYIEDICNKLSNDIEKELEYGYLSYRFSPGYGDLSIDIQDKFLKVLEAERNIGLTSSMESILFPRKSITAIIAIKDEKICRDINCTICNKYKECLYRRR